VDADLVVFIGLGFRRAELLCGLSRGRTDKGLSTLRPTPCFIVPLLVLANGRNSVQCIRIVVKQLAKLTPL